MIMGQVYRIQYDWLKQQAGLQKVIVLYGTRRVGKTWLLDKLQTEIPSDQILFLTGEDMGAQQVLANRTLANYRQLLSGKTTLIIDEAQYIPDIGLSLKLMIDQIKPLTIYVSGSSSFDLVNKTGEPLVGRSKTNLLHPIAQCEYSTTENMVETAGMLSQRLVYGSYPELMQLTTAAEKQAYLFDLMNGYLLKDIFVFENLKNPGHLQKLLQLLAWQVGSEVSLNELANSLGIHKATVDRYLQLLMKVFIIFPLRAYSNNLRKEIAKNQKWYFYDNGLRNAIIGNFSPLETRADTGPLWEQYFISERIKRNNALQIAASYFFWRTYDKQEIDFIEESNGALKAFECKYNTHKKLNVPVAFAKAYPHATFDIVDSKNYLPYILKPV